MRDFLARHFTSLLFTGAPEKLDEFLKRNQEFELELIYLTEYQINTIIDGEEIIKFDIDVFPDHGKIPAIIDLKSDIIKIHGTIHN